MQNLKESVAMSSRKVCDKADKRMNRGEIKGPFGVHPGSISAPFWAVYNIQI